MIVHIPHASTWIPPEERPLFLGEKLLREREVMTDWYCDELFARKGTGLVYPVSRLVCDPERFREDADEPMSAVGMGALYTRCSDGAPLRSLPDGERERLLRRYYDPHHEALERLVRRELEERGHALILDGHSFYPVPLPYEPDRRRDRPDFCVGTDAFHTPRYLAETLLDFLRRRGYSAEENSPYGGSIVPLHFYRREARVHSIMLEVNRALYLENGTDRSSRFGEIRAVVRGAMEALETTEKKLT